MYIYLHSEAQNELHRLTEKKTEIKQGNIQRRVQKRVTLISTVI